MGLGWRDRVYCKSVGLIELAHILVCNKGGSKRQIRQIRQTRQTRQIPTIFQYSWKCRV